jgi:hypothetical protein
MSLRKRRYPKELRVRENASVPENTAGQSGDLQGLPDSPEADSESVAELVEEGQSFEASVIEGIENVPDADTSEVKTKESPEDDVPPEYTQKDRP